MDTKFLFIPSWIIETVKANRGEVSQILNYDYIKNILSPDDLAEMVFFSENVSNILKLESETTTPLNPGLERSTTSFINLWNNSEKGVQPSISDVEKLLTYIAVNDCERSLNERLFATQTLADIEKTFDILHFDMGVIGVVIHPGAYTPGQSDENRFVLIRTLVLELTRLNEQDVVANTLLMRRYIELLSAR